MWLRNLFQTLTYPVRIVLAPEGYPINEIPPQGLACDLQHDKSFDPFLDAEVKEIVVQYDYNRDGTISIWLDVAVG